MRKNRKKAYMILLTTIGIVGSLFFIALGYWIAAAIGIMQTDGISFIQAFNKVLDNPFTGYFNNYTPIVMILGFIIFEFIFFIYLVNSRKNYQQEDVESEVEEMYTMPLNATLEGMFDGNPTGTNELTEPDYDNGFGIVTPEVEEIEVENSDEIDGKINDQGEIPDREISFSEDLAIELLETYDMEQITAMLKLSKYMEKIDTDLLRRMFDPGMSAQEIAEYINIFYGDEV